MATGGTGGHVYPAVSLSHTFMEMYQAKCHFLIDERAKKFLHNHDTISIHILKAATISARNPIALAKTAYNITIGFIVSFFLILKHRPDLVFVFGGYPSLPPALAAWVLRTKIAVHEQNATMGKVNRLIAKGAWRVFLSMEPCRRLPRIAKDIVCTYGNPLRKEFYTIKRHEKSQKKNRLLIVGGSQGAQFFTQTIPPLLAKMPPDIKQSLHIVQNAHTHDLDRLRAFYQECQITADIHHFISDIAYQMCHATLIISRSGASSVAEIIELNRPSILIPFAASIENDQYHNAKYLMDKGGAHLIEEKNADELYDVMLDLLQNHTKRECMSSHLHTIKTHNPSQKIAQHVVNLLHNENA